MDNMLKFVKTRLRKAKGRRAEIARTINMSYETLTNICEGASVNPRIGTLQPIYDFFKAEEAEEAELIE